MARVPYLNRSDLPAEHQDLLARNINLFRAMVHSPNGARAFHGLGGFIRHHSRLDPRLRELAILQVGYLTRSVYEYTHHIKIGRDFGVSDDDIRAIGAETAGRPSGLEPLARTVLLAAREMTAGYAISDETFAALAQALDHERLTDLVLTIAFYNAVVRFLADDADRQRARVPEASRRVPVREGLIGVTSAPRRELSLAHLTILDATPPELVSVAAAVGFRMVGIRLSATPSVGAPPYDMLGDTPVLRETLARLADTGVAVLDVEFLRFEPELPVGVPEGFLEAGARLGAKYVLVMSAEPEEARTLDRFGELCDRAAQYGLHVCLEFAIYTGVKTLAHAARIVRRAGRTNASILVDALHFSRSGGTPADIGAIDPSLLRYAQICDAAPHMPTDATGLIREARTGRLLPGEGVLPLAELVKALPAHTPLSVEAPVRATSGLSALERAQRAYRAMRELLDNT